MAPRIQCSKPRPTDVTAKTWHRKGERLLTFGKSPESMILMTLGSRGAYGQLCAPAGVTLVTQAEPDGTSKDLRPVSTTPGGTSELNHGRLTATGGAHLGLLSEGELEPELVGREGSG